MSTRRRSREPQPLPGAVKEPPIPSGLRQAETGAGTARPATNSKDWPNRSLREQAETDTQKRQPFRCSREDWTLFRSLPTLCQKAGVPQSQLLRLVLKELTDNALDAGGAVELGELDDGGHFVQDDGPGMPGSPEEIAALFSIRRPLVSSKLLRKATRGALGNGLRVAGGAALSTNGRIVVGTGGPLLRVRLADDGSTTAEIVGTYAGPGTRIEIHLPGLDDDDALMWAKAAQRMAGHGSSYKGLPSAHWHDSEAFFEVCQAAEASTVRGLVGELDGCTGARAGRIAGDFRGRLAAELSREEANALLARCRAEADPVPARRLGAVGPVPEWGAHAKVEGTFTIKSGRDGLDAEIPFVVEAWAEPADSRELTIHVNRTPVTGDVDLVQDSDERTRASVFGCNLGHWFVMGRAPMRFLLNVTAPAMQVTTDGKSPDLEPLLDEILEVLAVAARRAKRLRPGKGEAPSQKSATLDVLQTASALASGDGAYRFSQRQLFYCVRPLVQSATGSELQYGNFEKILTDHEACSGPIEGMYRDARGTLYHPHTGDEIPLGTLAVEEYTRPEWTFSKVLYAEKEGFFPILRAAGWPERHDCALLTSKGYASRAARDLLDLLEEDGEPITFFCIHDADGPGTRIFEALQEGTAARPGRKARIVNLGLEPEEALAMGLDIEQLERKGRVPVAAYVHKRWREWLQRHRVELNAMTTPAFLEWLDRKIAPYETGKLVPPAHVMESELRSRVRTTLRDKIADRLLREGGIDRLLAQALHQLEPRLARRLQGLPAEVGAALSDRTELHWTAPVADIVVDLASPPDASEPS